MPLSTIQLLAVHPVSASCLSMPQHLSKSLQSTALPTPSEWFLNVSFMTTAAPLMLLKPLAMHLSFCCNLQDWDCPLEVPWSPRARKPPADPRPHPEPGEVPVEAPPMLLALPTFAIFPENEEKQDGGDEDSVLSWSDTPRRHGATDEATSAPCERLSDSAPRNAQLCGDVAVMHDARQPLAEACMHMMGPGQHDPAASGKHELSRGNSACCHMPQLDWKDAEAVGKCCHLERS